MIGVFKYDEIKPVYRNVFKYIYHLLKMTYKNKRASAFWLPPSFLLDTSNRSFVRFQ